MPAVMSQLCVAVALTLPVACSVAPASGQTIRTAGQPAELAIRPAGECSVRITLRPVDAPFETPDTPALAEREPTVEPVISLRQLDAPVSEQIGEMLVEVRPDPLTIVVRRDDGGVVQQLSFATDAQLRFQLDDQPVLGLGEGGPLPPPNTNWREHDDSRCLTIDAESQGGWEKNLNRRFKVVLLPDGEAGEVVVENGAGQLAF